MYRRNRLLELLAFEDRRFACEIFGRSEVSINVVGLVPFHPNRRASNV